MFYVDLYFEFLYRNSKKSQYNIIGLQYLPECRKNLIENQSIYYKKCNIQISPHIFDPVRLLSTRLLHSLNRSMCVAIFPHKTKKSVCLGFFLHTSSMIRGFVTLLTRHYQVPTEAGLRKTFTFMVPLRSFKERNCMNEN